MFRGIVIATLALAATARAEAPLRRSPAGALAPPPPVAVATTRPPRRAGWLIAPAAGFPTIIGASVGAWFPAGEAVATIGGFGAMGAFAGSVELSAQRQVARWWRFSLDAGLAASTILIASTPIDCDGDEPCEDSVATAVVASPRLAARFRLSPARRLPRSWHIELGGGPLLGLCRGDCAGFPRLAVVGRLVMRL